MAKRPVNKITSDMPTRIPIPERLLQIADPKQKRNALEAHWFSYGYRDRYEVDRIENGHFVMVRKQTID